MIFFNHLGQITKKETLTMKYHTDTIGDLPDATVIRQFAIRTEDFEHFRACRKDFERKAGMSLSNSQTLTLILAEHREKCSRPA